MEHINIQINIDVCSKQELTTEEQQLADRALQASYHSFAPYSHFHVGAAVLLENGITVIGANQENAAFPSGLCGERACIFSAQSQYPDQPIRILAIASGQQHPRFAASVLRSVITIAEHQLRLLSISLRILWCLRYLPL